MQQSGLTCTNCGAMVRGRFCTACGTRAIESGQSSDSAIHQGRDASSTMLWQDRDPDATSTIGSSDLRDLLAIRIPGSRTEGDAATASPAVVTGGPNEVLPAPEVKAEEMAQPKRSEPAPPDPAAAKPRGPLTRLLLSLVSALTGRTR